LKSATKIAALALLAAACGCATERRVFGVPFGTDDVSALIARSPLPADQNIRVVEIARGPSASLHLIQIRDREVPHVHARYDLNVTLVRGKGTLSLGGQTAAMAAGDTAFIAREILHHFRCLASEPCAALVTFAPPFEAPDQQPVPAHTR